MTCCCCPCSLATGAFFVLLFFIYKFCCKSCCKKEPEFPRASTIPSISPFCLKVEAFLRLNKIPYENRFDLKARGKHGLLPFIELNGEQIADSEIIEERLKQHFNVKTVENEETVGRAITRLVSHHLSKVATKFRYIDETEKVVETFMELGGYSGFWEFLKPGAVWYFRRSISKKLKSNFGLFSNDEFNLLLRKDLNALKGLLGSKKYLMGDVISNVDASIFGHVATFLYYPKPGQLERIFQEEYPSLVEWAERVKKDLFPDDFNQ